MHLVSVFASDQWLIFERDLLSWLADEAHRQSADAVQRVVGRVYLCHLWAG